MTRSSKNNQNKVTLEYENLDLPPSYVDGVQGMLSPNKDVLHVSFFSDRTASLSKLSASATMSEDGQTFKADLGDSFGLDTGNVRLIRRVEANLIFTQDSLERIIPWLQQQLDTLSK